MHELAKRHHVGRPATSDRCSVFNVSPGASDAGLHFVGGAENASTGKRKYGKGKYYANLQSDKKMFGTSQVSVVYFQVGWASGLQIVFFLR